MAEPWELHAKLAAAARALQDEPDTQHTLDRAALLATELIPNGHYATISVVHRNRSMDTAAATDDLIRYGDQLQQELGEGPCLDAISHHHSVISKDLAQEPRWPSWASRVAAELNVHSALSVRLCTTANVVGALNLYCCDVDAFNGDDVDTATVLAAHIAVAVAQAQQADQLRFSAVNRNMIGQAQGILMERFGVNAQQAFDVLRRISQDNNVKLLRVTKELINTRKTPGT